MLSRFLTRGAAGAAVAGLVLSGPSILLPELANPAFAQAGNNGVDDVEGVAEEVVGDEAEEAAEQAAETAQENVEDELTGAADGATASDSDPLGPAIGLTVLSAASFLGGGVFLRASAQDRDLAASFAATDSDNANTLHERSDREKVLGISLLTLGGALAAGAIYMWVDHCTSDDDEPASDDVTWAPAFGFDGSVGIVGTF